jgi:hypothetical protein
MTYRYTPITTLVAGTLLLSGLLLEGSAASTVGSSLMDAQAQTPAYPRLDDRPPERERPIMTPEERLNLQKDLNATRDHLKQPAKPKPLRSQSPTKL